MHNRTEVDCQLSDLLPLHEASARILEELSKRVAEIYAAIWGGLDFVVISRFRKTDVKTPRREGAHPSNSARVASPRPSVGVQLFPALVNECKKCKN